MMWMSGASPTFSANFPTCKASPSPARSTPSSTTPTSSSTMTITPLPSTSSISSWEGMPMEPLLSSPQTLSQLLPISSSTSAPTTTNSPSSAPTSPCSRPSRTSRLPCISSTTSRSSYLSSATAKRSVVLNSASSPCPSARSELAATLPTSLSSPNCYLSSTFGIAVSDSRRR
ncbi:hypothetical protein BCR35DRAFT_300178 [Leucosporidium creatinivorum]|uniref:Uncharacterized protein n=1 Tax=Leucosporidium creatinivorum TaxID=106004 RepID=A0A1Y2G1Q4_9BASI|nr:hypothetical protein BCR35DRAFT_300178 [Leucosporidium creatinivorum]